MIRIKDLVKRYGKGADALVALDHLSLTLPDTGLVFILGKSGCGKSTLLNMLGGLDDVTEGEILYDGVDIAKLDETELNNYRNNYVGIIYQNFNLFEKETVYENIYVAGRKSDAMILGEKIDRLLSDLTLSDKKNSLIKNLSGGQKQRVAIARALVKDSRVILADEPTGNLDSKNTKMIFDILKETAKDRLVVVVSHDLKSAETYADRIISLSDGKIVDDVTRNPDFVETSNTVLDVPADCEISEEKIKEINVELEESRLELRKKDRPFTPTEREEAPIPQQSAEVKTIRKNVVTTFGVSLKFLKSSKASFIFSIILLSVIIALLAFSATLIDFDESGAIETINETYDAEAYILKKGYSPYDDPNEVNTSYLYEIGEKDIEAFREKGYTGNVYPIYNISLLNDKTDKYEHSSGRQYGFYSSGGLGVAVVDLDYLKKTFGEIEVLAGSLYGLEKNDKIVITDYLADSLLSVDRTNSGTDYTSEDPEDPYQKIVNTMLSSRFRVGAIIKTDYKEKYAELLDLYLTLAREPQREKEIRQEIYEHPLLAFFNMEVNTVLNYGYSVNPEYEKAILDALTDYDFLIAESFVVNDRADAFFSASVGTKFYTKRGSPTLAKGEMRMALTTYNTLFGKTIKADEAGFEPQEIVFKFHKYDEAIGAEAFFSMPIRVVGVYDNGKDTGQVGRLSDEDFRILKEAYVFPYALLFDDPYQCYELNDAATDLYYFSNLSVYSPVFTVCKIIDVFSSIFKFIFFALIVVAAIILLMHNLRVIKRSRYLIGVYKSMGYPASFFSGVSVLASLYLNLGIFAFSTLFTYLTTTLINKVLALSFAKLFNEPLIATLRLIGFSFPAVALYVAVVFGVSILTFAASIVSIRRLKPNTILHKAVE